MLSLVVDIIAALLTASGMAYGVIALWGARDFERRWRGRGEGWWVCAGGFDFEAGERCGAADVCGVREPLHAGICG